LGAPLTAITAAVVGVIVSLALFFAWHVLWPAGPAVTVAGAGAGSGGLPALGGFDPVAAGIMLRAALALFRYRRGVLEVVAGA
ncbi:hypothetical protein ABTB62_20150, partial [Acinetobacter baumannii]